MPEGTAPKRQWILASEFAVGSGHESVGEPVDPVALTARCLAVRAV